jgi:predicted dehydrogenase
VAGDGAGILTQPHRVAIVGYGLAGRIFHAGLIAATDGLRVDAIVTADPDRRAQAAAEHPDARRLDCVEALWDEPPPDLVVVASPTGSHGPIARAAVQRGIPVVVDKPLAPSAAEASELVIEADQAGVGLTVFQNRRWDSDILTLQALREAGRLGEIRRFESRFERWRPEPRPDAWREREPPERGGGQLLDLGSHLVDQALFLFGPVTHVYAEISAPRGLPGDDDAFLALRHAAGTISHLRASAVTAAPGPRLRVLGSRAALIVETLDSQEDALREGRRPGGSEWGREPAGRAWLVAGEASEEIDREPGDWPAFYRGVAAALNGSGPMPVDPSDAVRVLELLELARLSAAQQAVLPVPGPGR